MGERQNEPFQLSFNTSLKVDFQGSRVTSDGGLILVRELDEQLRFGDLVAEHLSDARRGKNTQLPLVDLFRQSIYSRAVVRFYNKRGTAEQWIKEGKQAVKMTRLSCHRFRSNEVRLWLSLMAYNLGNLWRRLVLPKRIDNWFADQFAATVNEDRWPVGQARALLLAAAGGEPFNAAAVPGDGGKDCRLTGGDGLEGGCWPKEITEEGGEGRRGPHGSG